MPRKRVLSYQEFLKAYATNFPGPRLFERAGPAWKRYQRGLKKLNQRGGGMLNQSGGGVLTTQGRFEEKDKVILDIVETSILPLVTLESPKACTTIGTLRTMGEGLFGYGYSFECGSDQSEEKYYLKISNPINIISRDNEGKLWHLKSFYKEHCILEKIASYRTKKNTCPENQGAPTPSPFIARYYGFLDFTGTKQKTPEILPNYNDGLFRNPDSAEKMYKICLDLTADKKVPANVFCLFLEKLDASLETKTSNELTNALCCLIDVTLGLIKIHSEGFAHNDIKPGNIMIKKLKAIPYIVHKIVGLDALIPLNSRGLAIPSYLNPKCNSNLEASQAKDFMSLGLVIAHLIMREGEDELFVNDTPVIVKPRSLLSETARACPLPSESSKTIDGYLAALAKNIGESMQERRNEYNLNITEFTSLIADMCHPDPTKRPNAYTILYRAVNTVPGQDNKETQQLMRKRIQDIYRHYTMTLPLEVRRALW